MQYKCIKKGKGFFGFDEGDIISKERYSTLSEEKKKLFEENFEDESIGEQIERNIENERDE